MRRGSAGALGAIILGLIVIFLVVLVFGKPLYRMVQPILDPEGTFLPKAEPDVLIKGAQTQGGAGAPVRISGTAMQMQSRLVNLLLDCWKFRDRQNYVCYRLELDMPSDNAVEVGSVFDAPVLRRDDMAKEMERRGQPDAAEALRDNEVADAGLPVEQRDYRMKYFPVGYMDVSSKEVQRPVYKMCVDHDRAANDDDLFLTHVLGFDCE